MGGREGRKRASRVVARFRGYSAAEDHREDYTPAAVARNQPLADPYIAHSALLRNGKDESFAGRGGTRRVSSFVYLIKTKHSNEGSSLGSMSHTLCCTRAHVPRGRAKKGWAGHRVDRTTVFVTSVLTKIDTFKVA